VGGPEIPFRVRGGLVRVAAVAAEREGAFAWDTGAEESVIGLRFARKAGLRLVAEEVVWGVGGAVAAFRSAPTTLVVGARVLTKSFLVADLPSGGSGGGGPAIDGLVGVDFLAGFVTTLDFARSVITLEPAATWQRQPDTGRSSTEVPLRMTTGAPCVEVAVGDSASRVWLRLDTGCAAAVELADPGGGAGGGSRVGLALGRHRGRLESRRLSVEIGGSRFERLPVVSTGSPGFPGEAGRLGVPVLGRFERVVIDPSRGTAVFVTGKTR
jgi:hypothetical protein